MLPKTLLTFCIVFCANMLYAQGKKTIDKKCTSSMCVNNKGGTMTGNTIIQGNVTNIYNIVGKDTVYMPTRDAQEKIRQAEEIIKREKSIAEREQAVYCLEEALNQPKPPENTELLSLDAFKV
ncbi:MAG: hypothetical protein RLZZ292_4027, partial [Bacteroidota bacterium]